MVLKNFDSFLYNILFINPADKWIIKYFSFDIQLVLFILNYFFYPKFFLIFFLQFSFLNCSNNLFTIEIISNICPRDSIFNFSDYKNVFRSIRSISFSKNTFALWYSNMIPNLKLIIVSLNFCILFSCLGLYNPGWFKCISGINLFPAKKKYWLIYSFYSDLIKLHSIELQLMELQ